MNIVFTKSQEYFYMVRFDSILEYMEPVRSTPDRHSQIRYEALVCDYFSKTIRASWFLGYIKYVLFYLPKKKKKIFSRFRSLDRKTLQFCYQEIKETFDSFFRIRFRSFEPLLKKGINILQITPRFHILIYQDIFSGDKIKGDIFHFMK